MAARRLSVGRDVRRSTQGRGWARPFPRLVVTPLVPAARPGAGGTWLGAPCRRWVSTGKGSNGRHGGLSAALPPPLQQRGGCVLLGGGRKRPATPWGVLPLSPRLVYGPTSTHDFAWCAGTLPPPSSAYSASLLSFLGRTVSSLLGHRSCSARGTLVCLDRFCAARRLWARAGSQPHPLHGLNTVLRVKSRYCPWGFLPGRCG